MDELVTSINGESLPLAAVGIGPSSKLTRSAGRKMQIALFGTVIVLSVDCLILASGIDRLVNRAPLTESAPA